MSPVGNGVTLKCASRACVAWPQSCYLDEPMRVGKVSRFGTTASVLFLAISGCGGSGNAGGTGGTGAPADTGGTGAPAGTGGTGAPAGTGGDTVPPPAVAVVDPSIDGQLSINELMAINVLTSTDEQGTASPWIEIYNPTADDVPLGGYGVTDDFSSPRKSVLPDGVVVPAGGHLVLWADGNPSAGAAHLAISLAATGGSLGLARPDGTFIDRLTYGAQTTDLSAAREPDGSTNWVTEWVVSPGAPNPAGAGQPRPPQADADPPESIPAAGDVSDRVLGYDLIPEFDLQISDANIASLRADPQTWVQATLVYQGRAYGPVGVNLKGTSSFQPIDGKPGFRININKFAKGAKFFGLKEFLLNNMTTDPSMVHERLSYWIARQVGGVPASRCNHAWVTLNGAPLGLYVTVEEPRGQLMSYYFTDPTGGVFTINYADFVTDYLGNFQYDDGSTDTTLIQQATAALAMQPADAAIAAVGPYVNLHEFARFWAVCVLMGHWGGWPYAATNEPAGANAELYADPTTKQLYFLPTGINDAMSTSDFDFVNKVQSILARTCAASASCFQDFASQLMEMDAMATQLGWAAEHDRVVAQIAPYVAMDTKKPYSNDDVAMFQQQAGYFITGRGYYINEYLKPPAAPATTP
jgi:CotH kinase protein/Lamin Tail Domain